MMDCSKARSYLSLHLDSELDAKTSLELESHLDVCPDCVRFFEQESEFETALKTALKSGADISGEWNAALRKVMRPTLPVSLPLIFILSGFLFFGSGLIGFHQFEKIHQKRQDVVLAALNNHQKYLADVIPMKIECSKEGELNTYFSGSLKFHLNEEALQQVKNLNLVGARLCHLKEVPVAFMVQHHDGRPVSVFVADAKNLKYFRQHIRTLGTPEAPAVFRKKDATISSILDKDKIVIAVGPVEVETLNRIARLYQANSTI